MTRLDELTLEGLDRELSPEEVAELERLTAEQPEGQARRLRLLQVEAALRGERRARDLAPDIVAQVVRRREDRVVAGVMSRVQKAQGPSARHRGRARRLTTEACGPARRRRDPAGDPRSGDAAP